MVEYHKTKPIRCTVCTERRFWCWWISFHITKQGEIIIISIVTPSSLRVLSEKVRLVDLVWLDWMVYGISTIVGYLMPNPLYTYIYIKNIWFGLVGFYGISTIVGYLMPNPLYTYILDIYDLVGLGFMAFQPL